MIVDSSAVVGILNGEPDAEALEDAREPLLFKGDDFGHTDLTSAIRA